jgi:hypothetical protein
VRHGEALGRFRAAVDSSDVESAIGAASQMAHVGLLEALEICRLLALSQDERFDRAATRWLLRLEGEGQAGLDELHLAAAAFSALGRKPRSEDAWTTLTSIVRAKD